jgi:hypothetical protein
MDQAGQATLRARMIAIGEGSDDASYRSFVTSLPDMIGLGEAQPAKPRNQSTQP